MEFGWFVGPKFTLCDGLDWVSRLVGWVGLKKLDPRTTLRKTVSQRWSRNGEAPPAERGSGSLNVEAGLRC